jgi:hypothetical protein
MNVTHIIVIIIVAIIGLYLLTTVIFKKAEDVLPDLTDIPNILLSPFKYTFEGLTAIDWGDIGHTVNKPFRDLMVLDWGKIFDPIISTVTDPVSEGVETVGGVDWGALGHKLNEPFRRLYDLSMQPRLSDALAGTTIIPTRGKGVLALLVTDEDNTPLGMANVTITNVSVGVGTRVKLNKITMPNGRLRLRLPEGIYTITAKKRNLTGDRWEGTNDGVSVVPEETTDDTVVCYFTKSERRNGGGGGGTPPIHPPLRI